METRSSSQIDLPAQAWRYLVHTLYAMLPPPSIDTPEALQIRNQAAIARIAALGPVNAAEAELAAQCIIARAQAEDVMRLIRQRGAAPQDDAALKLTMQLNAQYSRMVRTSLDAHSHLLREQQSRRKQDATPTAADTDEWTRHIAADAMLKATPIEPEAPTVPLTAETIPEIETKSHSTETETQSGQHPPRVVNFPAAAPHAAENAAPCLEMPPPRSNERPLAHAMASG